MFIGLEAINCAQFSKTLPSIMSWGSYHVNNILVKYNINHFLKSLNTNLHDIVKAPKEPLSESLQSIADLTGLVGS